MNVPTLDLSKFISGIDEERKAFSDDLGHSFNQTGFAIIKNHGLKKAEVVQLLTWDLTI